MQIINGQYTDYALRHCNPFLAILMKLTQTFTYKKKKMENLDMEALSTRIQVHACMLKHKHTHIHTSFPEVTIACCFTELYEEDFYL